MFFELITEAARLPNPHLQNVIGLKDKSAKTIDQILRRIDQVSHEAVDHIKDSLTPRSKLADLPDYILNDIGVTRADIAKKKSRSVAMGILKALAKLRIPDMRYESRDMLEKR